MSLKTHVYIQQSLNKGCIPYQDIYRLTDCDYRILDHLESGVWVFRGHLESRSGVKESMIDSLTPATLHKK